MLGTYDAYSHLDRSYLMSAKSEAGGSPFWKRTSNAQIRSEEFFPFTSGCYAVNDLLIQKSVSATLPGAAQDAPHGALGGGSR